MPYLSKGRTNDIDRSPIGAPTKVAGRQVIAAIDCTESLGERYMLIMNEDATASHPHGITPNCHRRYMIVTVEPVGNHEINVISIDTGMGLTHALVIAARMAYSDPEDNFVEE